MAARSAEAAAPPPSWLAPRSRAALARLAPPRRRARGDCAAVLSMAGRYTTKTRAKRIELHYFKRLYPFRRWKLILSIALPTIAAASLLVLAARGDQRVYTSGPVSTAHAMFNVQCGQCHVPARAAGAQAAAPAQHGFRLPASDPACLK